MQPLISLKDISLVYHSEKSELKAIDSISLNIYDREIISIVGPSGCGKSTLLSIISELILPSEGIISKHKNIKTGYMFQKDHLFEHRTVLSNACIGLEIQKKLNDKTRDNVIELLKKYGLEDFIYKRPSELSGGMRQRAALIRTLAINADILLLDEPFSALDYQTRLTVSDEIRSIIRQEKKTAILVTHDISEAISFSDRVIILSQRPARIINQIDIKFDIENNSSLELRNDPLFRDYFNTIWKELDR